VADLFISHTTSDDDPADRVYRAQTERGTSCWMAPRDIASGDFAKAINEAISACTAFAIIVSEGASKSDHVRRELTLAVTRRRTILPLVFDDYHPTDGLEYNLAGIQLIDCSGAQFEQGMNRVAAAVRDTPSPPPSPTPSPKRLRDYDFLAALSGLAAMIVAFSPTPMDAIPRTLIVAALLVFPILRIVDAMRGKHLFVRSAVLFLLLLVSAWILDRAFLRFVIRETRTPTSVLYAAPYGELHTVHMKASPAEECVPHAPRGATLFGWGGPVGEITIDTFSAPQTAGFQCKNSINGNALELGGTSRHEIWQHRTVNLIRQLFIAIGGLVWVSASLFFWRRRSSAQARARQIDNTPA
jgi:TIR domain